jgi:hypothetical protein
MVWLTWRQHRQQALAGGLALGVLALFLILTHTGIAHTFKSSGLAACLSGSTRDCSNVADTFDRQYRGFQLLIPLFLAVPLLVGLFWGAPLVARELEHGTHRLIWTQSVSRRRWLSTKLVLIAGASVGAAAAFAALVTWWSSMFVRATDERFDPGVFDVRGIVPIAYVLFALALGVAASALIRKTLPAMVATIAGFIGVRAIVSLFVRPHYMAARTVSSPVFAPGPHTQQILSGAWTIKEVTVDRAGRVVSHGRGFDFNFLASRCPGVVKHPTTMPNKVGLAGCLRRLGIHTVTTYQPGSRFWAFQGIESAIYIALAAALFVTAALIVRRRLA